MGQRPLWLRILLIILVVLAVAAAYIFWPVSEDLRYLADAGSEYDAIILRDTWGVPHIFGQTDADTAFGLAYAHAEDDFLTIQQTALAARGALAIVYGPDAAPNDYMVQLLRIWAFVDAQYEDLSPDLRAVLEAYATGLNRYAGRHADETLPGLFPLTGKDIVAGSVHKTPLFFGLDGVLTELFADERRRPVATREVAHIPVPLNSNAFAAGPGRTANGETFLAVNSHQPWTGPVAWYEAHLHSEEGWDMTGAIFPGAPVIIHGHNRDLGWGFTVNGPDLADVFVLDINPDNPNQYRFDGAWRDLEVAEARIQVKLLGRLIWPVKRELLWSVYGPTVRQEHGVYAVRYAGLGRIGIFEQLYRANKARNFAEWQAAMALLELPMFNVVYADREGNIYYLYNGLLPVRTEGYDWSIYLPGDTSATLWTDYLPFHQLPQLLNPPSGFVQNANSSPFRTTTGVGNPDPAGYSPTLGIDDRMSNRSLRLLALLNGDPALTEAAFDAIKYDVRYAPDSAVAALRDRLVAADLPDEPAVQTAVTLLRDWDLAADPDSRAAAVMVLTLNTLNETPGVRINPSKLVDVTVETAVLVSAFQDAAKTLVEQFGRVDVPWQEVNRLRRGAVDLGLGGAPDVPHAIYGQLGEDGRFTGIAGDSYILMVTWDADGRVRGRSIHQFGSATLDETSPHYADQAPLFARRELKPAWIDEADIRANLQRAYRPGEE